VDVFGYPYWQIQVDGKLEPRIPSSIPQNDGLLPPIDPELIPTLIPTSAPGMQGTPFFEIIVKNSPLGGSMIVWGLKRDFADPPPYKFEVYWAETPTGKFEKIDSPVLINTYWAVDPERRLFALDIESCYAIRMVTSVGEYWSYASNANANWNKKDWLIAREICRKEFLMNRKYVGWDGFLLKRMIWGAPCPRCADFDTKEAKDGSCLACFGTGKDGGYWAPFPTFAYQMEPGPVQFKQVDDNSALTENTIHQNMRVLAYPNLATNDVFIHYGSGRRFFIRPVNVAASIKGIPIIYTCEMRLAPYTDVIYQFPPAPPVPPKPPEPPAPPESEPYIAPPVEPKFKIQWANGEWQLGLDLEHVLYHTTGGYPMPNGLDSFTWEPSGLTFTETGDGYQIDGGDVAGLYYPAGDTASGLPVFERRPNA